MTPLHSETPVTTTPLIPPETLAALRARFDSPERVRSEVERLKMALEDEPRFSVMDLLRRAYEAERNSDD